MIEAKAELIKNVADIIMDYDKFLSSSLQMKDSVWRSWLTQNSPLGCYFVIYSSDLRSSLLRKKKYRRRVYLQLLQANSKEYLWMVLIKLLQSVIELYCDLQYIIRVTFSSTPFTYINRFLYVIHISFPSFREPHVACIYL